MAGVGELDYKVLNQRVPGLGSYGFVLGSQGNVYTGDSSVVTPKPANGKA